MEPNIDIVKDGQSIWAPSLVHDALDVNLVNSVADSLLNFIDEEDIEPINAIIGSIKCSDNEIVAFTLDHFLHLNAMLQVYPDHIDSIDFLIRYVLTSIDFCSINMEERNIESCMEQAEKIAKGYEMLGSLIKMN